MHTITIYLADRPDMIVLGFTTEDSAKKTFAELNGTHVGFVANIEDDFGQTAVISDPKNIAGLVISDVDKKTQLNSDMMLVNAHAQAKYMKRVKEDPVLMQAAIEAQRSGLAMPQRQPIIVGPNGPMNG